MSGCKNVTQRKASKQEYRYRYEYIVNYLKFSKFSQFLKYCIQIFVKWFFHCVAIRFQLLYIQIDVDEYFTINFEQHTKYMLQFKINYYSCRTEKKSHNYVMMLVNALVKLTRIHVSYIVHYYRRVFINNHLLWLVSITTINTFFRYNNIDK